VKRNKTTLVQQEHAPWRVWGARPPNMTPPDKGERSDQKPPNRVARGGVEPPTFRFSGGRSYQLSYLAVRSGSVCRTLCATQTGLEPATFAVTGRRANQLRHWALLV
jgi:hypothetical protein